MQVRSLRPLALVVCVLCACSGAPPTPPANKYLNEARNNLAASDFDAALKNLDRSVKAAGEDPAGQQASLLRAVLLTSLAEGSRRMAEAYGAGLKEPPAEKRAGYFSKMRADYYGIARVRLVNALEAVMDQRDKLSDKPISLQISFPAFTGSEDLAVTRIKSGHAVQDADRYRAELKAYQNARARTLASISGAGDDLNKGQEIFSKGSVEIDPRVYLIELSAICQQLGAIFERRAIDDPRYLRTVNEVVRDNIDIALKLLAAKPDKGLEARARKIRVNCEKTIKLLGS